jgi:hypothetical protein
MTSVTRQGWISHRHVVMLLLIGFIRSMTHLAVGIGFLLRGVSAFGVNINGVVTIGTGQTRRILQHHVMTISGLTLVTIMAVEWPRCIGVARGAVSLGRC